MRDRCESVSLARERQTDRHLRQERFYNKRRHRVIGTAFLFILGSPTTAIDNCINSVVQFKKIDTPRPLIDHALLLLSFFFSSLWYFHLGTFRFGATFCLRTVESEYQ